MYMEILRKIYAFFLDTIQTFLLAAAVFLVIYAFLFRPFEVKGDSMYPSFKDKQYVLTNLISLRFGNPKFGDVVVFKAPNDKEKDYIKRVIGLPGDVISVKDGNIYINSRLFDQSKFLKPDVKTYAGSFLKESEEVVVPPDSFFVFGDNRPYSSDSREWGFVNKSDLIGISFFVYWPLSDMQLVKNPL
jgi:signal peptidase I